MAKRCVFCGRPPEQKTKEHVIPRWLIETTGDPSRAAYFGVVKSLDRQFRERTFAFDQFTFPACAGCNNKHSKLEVDAKAALEAILAQESLSSEQLSRLLDWFDKVRVGLWLGMNQLDKNIFGVVQNFAIEHRIGQYDRLLAVEKTESSRKKLNFSGVDTIAFAFTPSAFGLVVNNYYFTNVSSMFLVARRLGFPYGKSMYATPNSNHIEVKVAPGKERVIRPIVRKRRNEMGPSVYQPMFPGGLGGPGTECADSPYVRSHSMEFDDGIGNLFVERGNNIREVPKNSRVCLEPENRLTESDHYIRFAVHILEWQEWLNQQVPDLSKLSRDERSRYMNWVNRATSLNRKMRGVYNEQLRKGRMKGVGREKRNSKTRRPKKS